MLQRPAAQRGLFHLGLAMRFQQCGDARIGYRRHLDAPARPGGVGQRPVFQNDPLVERCGIVGEERAGRADRLLEVGMIDLCQQDIEALVGVAAAQSAIVIDMHQARAVSALRERQPHVGFPLLETMRPIVKAKVVQIDLGMRFGQIGAAEWQPEHAHLQSRIKQQHAVLERPDLLGRELMVPSLTGRGWLSYAIMT